MTESTMDYAHSTLEMALKISLWNVARPAIYFSISNESIPNRPWTPDRNWAEQSSEMGHFIETNVAIG